MNHTQHPPGLHLPDLSLELPVGIRTPDGIRGMAGSYSSVHLLQWTSSWHPQSGLALTKTTSMFCFEEMDDTKWQFGCNTLENYSWPKHLPQMSSAEISLEEWEGWMSAGRLGGGNEDKGEATFPQEERYLQQKASTNTAPNSVPGSGDTGGARQPPLPHLSPNLVT